MKEGKKMEKSTVNKRGNKIRKQKYVFFFFFMSSSRLNCQQNHRSKNLTFQNNSL